MPLSQRFRKFALTVHVIVSASWLGAVVAYLALAVAGLTSGDGPMVRAAYLSLEVIGWFVIVPLSLATLLAGLVESLGTAWGLFRHWWVLVKFVLTTGAIIVLLQHMPSVTHMSRIAAAQELSAGDFRELRMQLVIHAGGGLLVLLAATLLSVLKPWGLTPYGMRKQRDGHKSAGVDSLPRPEPAVEVGSRRKTPRWAYIVGIHAVALALLFLVLHLAGGGMRHH